ncbi:multi antimicrobial extrusion protein (Na(+)/drug antiporter), MATE family of MDR efflux pumps [Lachnospiraceae bacterium KM106-2]|nr:multi antimicrobial extrusion protein (Na(+)/drug antiporter), MATE family of MDR efflux pumps [Lachnospiraceae bacterium KM106-2]
MGREQEDFVQKTSLFHLAWPIFVETTLAILIGNVDSLMLSRYSETAVGSVGNANQILNLLTLTFNIIAGATGVIVAQYLGARLKEKINEIYSVAIVFNLVISLAVSGIILIGSSFILGLMHVPKEMLGGALSYLRLLGGFIFLQAVFNTFTQIFRSNGRTKIGMFIALSINLLNIIGNYLFLYGPLRFLGLGVTGVAISSVVSRVVAVLAAIYCFIKYIDGEISIKYIRPFPMETLKKMIRIGVPTAGESMSYSFSQLIIMSFVNVLGTRSVNAKIFMGMLTNFSFIYTTSIAQGTQIIVGHLIGAGDENEAYHRVLKALRQGLIASIGLAVVNYLLSPYTLRIFTTDPETLSLANKAMAIAVLMETGRASNLVVISSMRSAGDIKFPTYLGIASMWGISAGFSYILGLHFGFGLLGIITAMAMDEVIRGIIVIIRWIRGNWRGRSLITSE